MLNISHFLTIISVGLLSTCSYYLKQFSLNLSYIEAVHSCSQIKKKYIFNLFYNFTHASHHSHFSNINFMYVFIRIRIVRNKETYYILIIMINPNSLGSKDVGYETS